MPSIFTDFTPPSLPSPWKSAAFTKPIAPAEVATFAFTLWVLVTSLGGVADLPVNAAFRKYLPKSASLMPHTILRNAVRSGAPAVTITGATDLPVSHLLRSDRKSFFRSLTERFSTGFAAFTMTTIGSPAACTVRGGITVAVASSTARTAIPRSLGFDDCCAFMSVSL
jgi:hypothetical protein